MTVMVCVVLGLFGLVTVGQGLYLVGAALWMLVVCAKDGLYSGDEADPEVTGACDACGQSDCE